MYECNGRIALVTGASRGIGAAIAVRLAAAGASVAITARTMHEEPGASVAGSLQSTVAAVEAVGGRAYPVVADLTDPDSRAQVVPAVEAALGPIDVLVNNAAIAWYGNVEDLTRRRARLLMELDYHAPVELTQAALPAMRERRTGWIVNVSSVLARHPEPAPFSNVLPMTRIGWHYGAAKAALALATGDPAVLTGRIVTSGELLAELDRRVHTLDGSSTRDVVGT